VRPAHASIEIMSGRRRTLSAWLSLSALVFLQLAVSAYACNVPSVAGMPHAVSSEPPMPCHTAPEPSKLCEQHCVQPSQSVDTQPQGTPAVPVLALLAVVRAVDPYVMAGRQAQYSGLVAGAGRPPLVRFGVLRI